jgi:HSP20 family protein
MTLLKAPVLPSLFTDKWMSDFFDNDRFFDADWLKRMQIVPAVNVKELDKEFEIEMAAPGLTKKDFHIRIENGVMTIFTEKKIEKEEKEETFTRREFNYTSFTRSFNLPENVNPDKIDAKYENGILRILVGKKVLTPEKPMKTIEVK